MEFVIQPWHWLILGICLMLSELILPAFAALWFGISALILAFLVWLFPALPFPAQLLIWGILSIVCTVAWFKWIKPLSTDKIKASSSRETAIGQVGMVIETHLMHEHIKVRFHIPVLGADEWQCRCLSDVAVGDRVRVVDILGNDLLVQPYLQQYDSKKI